MLEGLSYCNHTARVEGRGIQGGPPPCAGGPGTGGSWRIFAYFLFGHLYNTSATVKKKRVTQKEFPAKMVVATQTRRRETPMSHYQHLTISERESIWENKLAGKSLREIARQTGRSVTTISRELKRNGTSQKYRPSEAQKKYERRRKRCRRKKLLQEGELKDLVVRLLTQQQWSPEQSHSESSWRGGRSW